MSCTLKIAKIMWVLHLCNFDINSIRDIVFAKNLKFFISLGVEKQRREKFLTKDPGERNKKKKIDGYEI